MDLVCCLLQGIELRLNHLIAKQDSRDLASAVLLKYQWEPDEVILGLLEHHFPIGKKSPWEKSLNSEGEESTKWKNILEELC